MDTAVSANDERALKENSSFSSWCLCKTEMAEGDVSLLSEVESTGILSSDWDKI